MKRSVGIGLTASALVVGLTSATFAGSVNGSANSKLGPNGAMGTTTNGDAHSSLNRTLNASKGPANSNGNGTANSNLGSGGATGSMTNGMAHSKLNRALNGVK